MLQPGEIAPDFDLPALIGGGKKRFHLAERIGRQRLVLAFYPLNWEPVSERQMVNYQVQREKPPGSERLARLTIHYAVISGRTAR